MKGKNIVLMTLVLVLLFGINVLAGSTATQTVNITVEAINEIAISGDVNITINAATAGITAGDSTFNVTDATTTMDVTTNETGKKISAILSGDYTNITLKVELTIGGVDQGVKTLNGTTAADLATFDQLAEAGITVTYTASCTNTKAPAGLESRIVTFTLADNG